MNPTPMDWLLLATIATLLFLLMYMKTFVRELEKRTDVLEFRIELLDTDLSKAYGKIDWTPNPAITIENKAEADDVQMLPKNVPFRFVEGDEDPLPGLPRRYG